MIWIRQAGRDVRHALRTIVRMPAFSAVVIVSLGVGIGVNTVIFSWIQARLLDPIPGVPGGARFHLVEPRVEASLHPGASWLEYHDLRERLRSFPAMLAFRMVPLYLGETSRVERVYGLLVSDNYFSVLGLRPAIGRFLRRDDVARAGGEPVAVISYGLWQAGFGGAPEALGRTVRVNGHDLAIVGVAPRKFQGTVTGLNFELWLPATLAPVVLDGSRELEDRSVRGYSLMGRLEPPTTRAQAQSELDAAMRDLARIHPDTNATVTAEVLPLWQSPRGPQRLLTTALAILQAVMLLLLLAVCGNAANLVLARASTRQREIGVRLTLGAGPSRIVSLLLVENVVLASLGAGLGAAMAVWGTQALRLLPLTGLPLRFETSVDGLGLAFSILLGIGSGTIVGAAPAAQLARLDPLLALRAAARTSSRSRMRNALMGIQVALALVVLIVAGLFLRSFIETRETHPGFRREGVLLAAYDLTGRGADATVALGFAERLLERLRALPGVEAAAIAAAVPLDIHGMPMRSFALEGRARADGSLDRALANTVTPGYFQAMDIPLRAGEDFADLEDARNPPQAVVNEEFVRRYVEGMEPARPHAGRRRTSANLAQALGRRIRARGRDHVISGVVADSLYNAFGEPPTPMIYFSYRDGAPPLGEIHLRTRPGAEAALAPEVRKVVREIDPGLPVFNVRTLGEHVETNLVFRRVPARMFAVLGPMLLALAAIGIYAVVSYTVSLRTTEIGLRLALGATAGRVVRRLVGESMVAVGFGALGGWLVALAVAAHAVNGGGSIDLAVFAGVPVILLLVATIACWVPARRAARADPMVALRQD